MLKLRPIKHNMNVIELMPSFEILFSYQTPVAARIDSDVYVTDTKHSATTTRHINEWLHKWLEFKGTPQKRSQNWFDDIPRNIV